MADNYITNKQCRQCGQPRRRKSRQYCSAKCYQAGRFRFSDPVSRFWKHVNKTDTCWLWQASKNSNGYGQFTVKSRSRPIGSHRYAWELLRGPIPSGLGVLHRCDTPICVNPDHLFLGTAADNNRDMIEKGRDRKRGLKGEHNTSAKLTEDSVREIRAARVAGVKLATLAAKFGVCEAVISAVATRRTWKHVA